MPSGTPLPPVAPFRPVGPTAEPLEYADLVTLDLSQYDKGPEARNHLAKQLNHAMRTQGFFVVVNHGISKETIDRQINIGHHVLTQTSLEEKQRLEGHMKAKGTYQGFKLRNYWTIDNGVKDQIEQYNWNRDLTKREHPSTFRPFIPEVQELNDHVHKVILYRLLTLFALSLELPEDFFTKLHKYETFDESWFRYMMYFHGHHADDMVKTGGVWLKGHCDFGSLTLLFSQPMVSLQLMDHKTKDWRWIKYVPGAIVVNAGEMFEWWTGGYYKATIHRVCQPPKDQRNQDRCGLFYFVVPNEEVKINTLLEDSPVLRAAGVERRFEPGTEPTSAQYRAARIGAYGTSALFTKKGSGVQEEVVGGVTTKHYN
ncbi:Clavaminate synthase-like protein [Ilyonectria destructans]|nr:Clavaminate synthase-like protein [Ilyonectria destructans]